MHTHQKILAIEKWGIQIASEMLWKKMKKIIKWLKRLVEL
jgi:hypothetical protein